MMHWEKKAVAILLALALISGFCVTGIENEAKAAEPEESVKTEKMLKDAGERKKVTDGVQMIATQAAYKEFDTKVQYVVKNVHSGCYLNIPGNSSKRVAPITIWTEDNTTGQRFTFAKVGKWYTMTPVCAPSMRVNIEGEKAGHDVKVGIYENTNHATQGWYFEPVSGGYVIRSAENTKFVLDICGKAKGNYIKVKECDPENCPGQVWTVEKYAAPKSTLAVSLKLGASSYVAGKTNSVSGAVKSNYNLKQVTLSVDGTSLKKSVNLNTNSYSLPSDFTNAMKFNQWKGGKTYTLRLTAKDASGKTAAATAACTVKKSSLAVSPKIGKAKITAGSKNGVSGKVTSNKKITKITVKIIGKGNKKTYFSKTVNPKKTSYKLTGTIDNAMKFDKLSAGTYLLTVTAWDDSGNKVSKSLECTVLAKAKAGAKAKTGTKTKAKTGTKAKANTKTYTIPYDAKELAKLGSQKGDNDEQGKCGAYAISYCRFIAGKSYKTADAYWSKGGADWPVGGMKSSNPSSFQKELNSAYKQVKANKPCIIRVYENSVKVKKPNKPNKHYVVVIGYKGVTNTSKVKLSQLKILDPWNGKVSMGNKYHKEWKGHYQIISFK